MKGIIRIDRVRINILWEKREIESIFNKLDTQKVGRNEFKKVTKVLQQRGIEWDFAKWMVKV